MDETIIMHQLQCAGKGQRQMPVNAAQTGKLQRQHRADTLTTAQNRVAHGLIQLAIGHVTGKQAIQIALDRLLVFLVSCFVIHIIPRLKSHFPPARRQGPSSA